MKRFTQVHCLLDCYVSILEEDDQIDFRPLYIGVWDDHFESNEEGIFYYSDTVQGNWMSRFTMLYGDFIEDWYDDSTGKQRNIDLLIERMQDRSSGRASIILVDLFYLSYTIQYRTKHFPHYIIVKQYQRNKWRIKDPYFDYDGCISNEEMRDAFGFNQIGCGLTIEKGAFQRANEHDVIHLFEANLNLSPGKLLIEVERFIHTSVEKNSGYAPMTMSASIQEVLVISKRFGGYDYAVQYVSEQLGIEYNETSPVITELIKGWENLMLTLVRYQILNKPVDLKTIAEKMKLLHRLEISVKTTLLQMFKEWQSKVTAMVCEVQD